MSAGMSICFIEWCVFFDIVPRAPITTGMTTTLTFQTFCNSNLKSWYLLIFFCSLMAMFWSPGIAKSVIWHSLFFAYWYKLCLVVWLSVLYNFICLKIEILKVFIFIIFLDCLWIMCVPLVAALKWYFLHSNQCT